MIVALHRNLSSIGCISGRLGFSPHITTQAMARDSGYIKVILVRILQAHQSEHPTETFGSSRLTLFALMLLFVLPTLSIHKHSKLFRYSTRAVFGADPESAVPPSTLAEYT